MASVQETNSSIESAGLRSPSAVDPMSGVVSPEPQELARKMVAGWPPLSDEQSSKLRMVLGVER